MNSRPPRSPSELDPDEFRVVLHRRGWAVTLVGRDRPLSVHHLREDAISLARRLAVRSRARVVVDEPTRPAA